MPSQDCAEQVHYDFVSWPASTVNHYLIAICKFQNINDIVLQRIAELEEEVASLKGDIRERDTKIFDRDQRMATLKTESQQLAKFKFVLEYKLEEVKSQLEPKEAEIASQAQKLEVKNYSKWYQLQCTEFKILYNSVCLEIWHSSIHCAWKLRIAHIYFVHLMSVVCTFLIVRARKHDVQWPHPFFTSWMSKYTQEYLLWFALPLTHFLAFNNHTRSASHHLDWNIWQSTRWTKCQSYSTTHQVVDGSREWRNHIGNLQDQHNTDIPSSKLSI